MPSSFVDLVLPRGTVDRMSYYGRTGSGGGSVTMVGPQPHMQRYYSTVTERRVHGTDERGRPYTVDVRSPVRVTVEPVPPVRPVAPVQHSPREHDVQFADGRPAIDYYPSTGPYYGSETREEPAYNGYERSPDLDRRPATPVGNGRYAASYYGYGPRPRSLSPTSFKRQRRRSGGEHPVPMSVERRPGDPPADCSELHYNPISYERPVKMVPVTYDDGGRYIYRGRKRYYVRPSRHYVSALHAYYGDERPYDTWVI